MEKLEEFGELLLVCNCANYTVIKAEVVWWGDLGMISLPAYLLARP